jgi:RNA polymerase-binding transcription factor DksA
VTDLDRIKSINNYINKRMQLLKTRKELQDQINNLRREIKLIDKQLPRNRFCMCPKCDYIGSTKLDLSDHIYNIHAY